MNILMVRMQFYKVVEQDKIYGAKMRPMKGDVYLFEESSIQTEVRQVSIFYDDREFDMIAYCD